MRVPIKELMDNLGVGYILSAYETCPWSAYDDENDVTCSAEVRMNSDGDELEAEMQIMRAEPKAGEKAIEQIFWLMAKPAVADQWEVKIARINNENKSEEIHAWESKSAAFFLGCVQELKLGKIPNIDEIYEREINKKERFGGNSQGGGSKSPKIKPQAILGMKTGR